FSSLSKNAKKSVLLKSAPFIGERRWVIFKVMLYQVNNFYTEVFFVPWSKKPLGFRSFYSTNKLQPYLKQIDVSSLMLERVQ
ncbi:MAG TPA: hypothetical protein VEY06_09965, partial [Flavisolibacter sp.]|nr:hypothetical protein [Flavisolibacter sp.]